jgi:hypothetical protein
MGRRDLGLSSAEVSRMLPGTLVDSYEELFWLAFRTSRGTPADAGTVAGAKRVTRLSTSQTETRGGSKGSRRSGGSQEMIASQKHFNFKSRIDARLRRIAREITYFLDDTTPQEALRRCSVCRTFGESSWLYCPKDGKPMENVEPRKKAR